MLIPAAIQEFLSGRRLAVAGVSRRSNQPANAIYHRLRKSGYEVVPVNPNMNELDGRTCYPDLPSVGRPIDGVIVATHPDVAAEVVRQCEAAGVRRAWFHRSFGQGSVSSAALDECAARGVHPIVGGCPLMYCKPDPVHRCMRWWLEKRGRIAG